MLNRSYKNKQSGFTLIEIIVALAISSILMLALAAVFSNVVRHSNESLSQSRLYQNLSAALDMVANDIRRAGYWGQAVTDVGTGTNTNPFMSTASGVDLTINGNCVTLSYDRDSNGTLAAINTANDDERYGYRLTAGAIQARPSSASFSCGAGASTWEDITDPNLITVTAFTLTPTTYTVDVDGTASLLQRYITISITGELATDPTVNKTLTYTVRVRNDKFVP